MPRTQNSYRTPQVIVKKRRTYTRPSKPIVYPTSRFAQPSLPLTTVQEAATITRRSTAEEKSTPGKRGETKEERFDRLIPPRVNRTTWSIEQVTFGAAKERYDCTPEKAKAVWDPIIEGVNRGLKAYGLPQVVFEQPTSVVADAALVALFAEAEAELKANRESTLEALRREAEAKEHEAAKAKAEAEELDKAKAAVVTKVRELEKHKDEIADQLQELEKSKDEINPADILERAKAKMAEAVKMAGIGIAA